MKLLNFFTKFKQKNKNSSFAEFFLHASDKEMEDVVMEAARRANEDQRALLESINKLDQKTT